MRATTFAAICSPFTRCETSSSSHFLISHSHKENNSVQLVQLHECTLEASLAPPSELQPAPADMLMEISSIAMHDECITIFHGDGTRRVMQMKEYDELKNRPLRDKEVTPEERGKSFLSDTVTPEPDDAGKKKKKTTKKKKKKAAASSKK
jgi:hypothetical protein